LPASVSSSHSTVDLPLPSQMTEDMAEVRRSFKRVERYSSKMAREMGHIETLLSKYGIAIEFTTTFTEGNT